MNVLRALSDRIQAIDFDHVFVLDRDGNLSEPKIYTDAPSVYNDPNADIEIQGEGWDAMRGLTGQYSYHGAVMHSSEVMGGSVSVVRAMLDLCEDEPRMFAMVVVNVWPEDDDDDPEPAGWAIVYR